MSMDHPFNKWFFNKLSSNLNVEFVELSSYTKNMLNKMDTLLTL